MESRESLRVLLIGKGGRESALAVNLSHSPRVEKSFVVPGNGGTARGIEKVSNIENVSEGDFDVLVKLAQDLKVNLVVPGRLSLDPNISLPLFALGIRTDLKRAGCTNSNWDRRIFSFR